MKSFLVLFQLLSNTWNSNLAIIFIHINSNIIFIFLIFYVQSFVLEIRNLDIKNYMKFSENNLISLDEVNGNK